MKLRILGTGNAGALQCYNTCFVLDDEGQYFLIDCGGGNTLLKQLAYFRIALNDISHVFISHRHLDHLTGALWIMRMSLKRIKDQKRSFINIYAHDEVINILRQNAQLLFTRDEYEVIDSGFNLVEVNDGDKFDINGRTYHFFDIHSNKAKQFGFYTELKKGRLCFLGDEPYRDCEYEYTHNATYLLHEAFCLDSEKDIYHPYAIAHTTVKDAAENASKLNIKNLLLYHTQDNRLESRKDLYTLEAARYFNGNIYVPDDLDTIEWE